MSEIYGLLNNWLLVVSDPMGWCPVDYTTWDVTPTGFDDDQIAAVYQVSDYADQSQPDVDPVGWVAAIPGHSRIAGWTTAQPGYTLNVAGHTLEPVAGVSYPAEDC